MTPSDPLNDPKPFPATPGLLRRVQQCDQAAWQRFVQLLSPLVYSWLRRAGLHPAEAVLVGQATFAILARNLPSYQPESGEAFRDWLREIARQQLQAHQSQQQTQDTPSPAVAATTGTAAPVESSAVQEHQLLVGRALELLQPEFDPASWQAFCRLTIDGQPAEQVAVELGLSLAFVYLSQARILSQFRREFENLIDV